MKMLKGVLVAFGVILASIPVPIVHFVAVPVGPFVAGFVGGGIARADEGRIVIFGLIVGGLALIPAAVLLLATLVMDLDLGLPTGLVVAAAIALVPYTWFGVTVGALISFLLRDKDGKDAGEAPAGQAQ